jgi:hypothetical protein
MTIFGRVVRLLGGRPVWAANRYDPGDTVERRPLYIHARSLRQSPVAKYLIDITCTGCWKRADAGF